MIKQQTICTVPRMDMNVLMFDRLDMVVYNEFDDRRIAEDSIDRIKARLSTSEYTKNLSYTDEQIAMFINIWNAMPKRPLAPYDSNYMGNVLAQAIPVIWPDIKPLRCSIHPNTAFYELTQEMCATLIAHLDNLYKTNDLIKQMEDYNASMAIDLFDMDEVFAENTEYTMIPDMIATLKRIQKQDFTKKMSYILIS